MERGTTIAVAVAVVTLVVLGASDEPVHAQRRSMSIEFCWFPTSDKEDYIINNVSHDNSSVSKNLGWDDGNIRLKMSQFGDQYLFCPFMSDTLFDHSNSNIAVFVEGWNGLGGGTIDVNVCADEHFGMSTSCTSTTTLVKAAQGPLEFGVFASDAAGGGWIDTTGVEDRSQWYPYTVYHFRDFEALYLSGYRAEVCQ